jgi:hypothetical protein
VRSTTFLFTTLCTSVQKFRENRVWSGLCWNGCQPERRSRAHAARPRRLRRAPLEVARFFSRPPRAPRHLEVRAAPRVGPLYAPDRPNVRCVGPLVRPWCPLPCAPYHRRHICLPSPSTRVAYKRPPSGTRTCTHRSCLLPVHHHAPLERHRRAALPRVSVAVQTPQLLP